MSKNWIFISLIIFIAAFSNPATALVLNSGDYVLIQFSAPIGSSIEVDGTPITTCSGSCVDYFSQQEGESAGGPFAQYFFQTITEFANPEAILVVTGMSIDVSAFSVVNGIDVEATLQLNGTPLPTNFSIGGLSAPECSTWAMMLIGFIGLGMLRCKSLRRPCLMRLS